MSQAANQELALFPLTAHVLPGGCLPLRIFEPRYMRLVREACSEQRGFAICMASRAKDQSDSDSQTHSKIHALATRVSVIDFSTLDDGMLGITVQGQERVRVLSVIAEDDGLKVAECEPLGSWPPCPLPYELEGLAEHLAHLYKEHDELGCLYPSPRLDDATWVSQRWLEVLPVAPSLKQHFMAQPDPQLALTFLARVLQSGS